MIQDKTIVNIIFPHQLFADSPLPLDKYEVHIIEEELFFNQFKFHKQKIAFHRATMKNYASVLSSRGCKINYTEATSKYADIRKYIKKLNQDNIEQIHYIDPTDNWIEKRLYRTSEDYDIELVKYDSPLFLNTPKDLQKFFKPTKKKFFQTSFYKQERKKRDILMDGNGEPMGGKWSFDHDNRKRFPKSQTPPPIIFPDKCDVYDEAIAYVEAHYADCPGEVGTFPRYPIDAESTNAWFEEFLSQRFEGFGPYEDAIVSEASILHHSVLTPMLNVGLITPDVIIERALKFARKNNTRINSVEGFVRQIIGWREFMRGMYEVKGVEQRNKNFWNFHRKIPASFYDGTTGIVPIDKTIKKILKTGYCHHIERLMILGSFMLLCEFDPKEVYRWFMELFIDAYDWVMVPNVYGMSQFADGGLLSTKPYISGSNYIMKMSDYKKGPWQDTWDGLFWRFMDVHRDFFSQNPRLGMLLSNFDKMPNEKQHAHHEHAEKFLALLDS